MRDFFAWLVRKMKLKKKVVVKVMKFLKESIAKKKKKKLTTEKSCWDLGGGWRMFYKI